MEITEVRIKLMEDNSGSNERLQAFCSLTFDDMFVIRDLKIIEGAKGFFVAMPSRKRTDRCHNCSTKNHLRSRFCNQCGCKLDENRALRDADGRAKLHADIAHPINSMCREKIQGAVLAGYAEELQLAAQPGYVSRYKEYEADEFDSTSHVALAAATSLPLLRRGPLRGGYAIPAMGVNGDQAEVSETSGSLVADGFHGNGGGYGEGFAAPLRGWSSRSRTTTRPDPGRFEGDRRVSAVRTLFDSSEKHEYHFANVG